MEFRSRSLRWFVQLLSPFTHIGKPCLFMFVICSQRKLFDEADPPRPAHLYRHPWTWNDIRPRRRNFNDWILSFFLPSLIRRPHKTIRSHLICVSFHSGVIVALHAVLFQSFVLFSFLLHLNDPRRRERGKKTIRGGNEQQEEINWDIKLNEKKNASTQSCS